MNQIKKLIQSKLDWTNNFNAKGYTRDEFLSMWIFWLAKHEFLKTFGDVEGYIILRPANLSWVFDAGIDYFNTLFWFDPAGDTVWIDSLWAPGRYGTVLEVIRATRRTYVAWAHKNGRIHCQKISVLSGRIPVKSQIKSALIKHTVN
jgi:hypothetical protein